MLLHLSLPTLLDVVFIHPRKKGSRRVSYLLERTQMISRRATFTCGMDYFRRAYPSVPL